MDPARKTGNKIIHTIHSIGALTEEFIDGFQWPEGIEIAIFCPKKAITEEFSALGRLAEKHSLWIAYSAAASDMCQNPDDCGSQPGLTISSVPDNSQLAALFLETREEYYRSINKTMSEWQIQQRDSFIKHKLPDSRRICVQKQGKTIALLMLTKAKDLQEMPVDWVPWVWILRGIEPAERRFVHTCFRTWLKDQVLQKVQCVVSAYNWRSQKFFSALGFRPECVHLIKPK